MEMESCAKCDFVGLTSSFSGLTFIYAKKTFVMIYEEY